MKNTVLFILAFLVSCCLFAQRDAQFYQTLDGEFAFKLEQGNCTLYELAKYNGAVYFEYNLKAERDFESQSDSLGILFSNTFYAVSYDYKYFRVLKMKKGKPRNKTARVAKRVEDPGKLFEMINHSHWNKEHERMLDDLQSDFDLFRTYRYRYFDTSWEPLEFKQVYPEEFELQAKQRIQLLKDSLTQRNNQLIALNDTIEKKMHTLTLEELKTNFQKLPLNEYAFGEYTAIFLETVAEERPDLYLELAETVPAEKKVLFGQAAFDRDMHRSIKKFQTTAPVKKEYMKYKRREHFKAGLILTGVGMLQIGIVTGLVFLFF